jgi:hypothetical protein
MICQRCGKACASRTEGRRVRLAAKELFFCNACSLHAVAGSAGGDRESTRGVPRAASRMGELAAPP